MKPCWAAMDTMCSLRIDFLYFFLKNSERLPAVLRKEHMVSIAAQHGFIEFEDAEIVVDAQQRRVLHPEPDRKSTRLNSSHLVISYAVFCLKKKKKKKKANHATRTYIIYRQRTVCRTRHV